MGKLHKSLTVRRRLNLAKQRDAVACQLTPVLVRAATSTCIAPLESLAASTAARADALTLGPASFYDYQGDQTHVS